MWWARYFRCLTFGKMMTFQAVTAKKLLTSFSKHKVRTKRLNWVSFVHELWQASSDWRDCGTKCSYLYHVLPAPPIRLPHSAWPPAKWNSSRSHNCLSAPAFCPGKDGWRQEQEGSPARWGHSRPFFPCLSLWEVCTPTDMKSLHVWGGTDCGYGGRTAASF